MPIAMSCPCGKKFRVRDEDAGRKVRCPGCQQITRILAVPDASSRPHAPAIPSAPPPPPIPSRTRDRVTDEEYDFVTETPSRDRDRDRDRPKRPLVADLAEEDDFEDLDRPRRRGRRDDDRSDNIVRRRPRRDEVDNGNWFGTFNAGMGGGLLMMMIAVVWFVGGLACDIIFFYPPILFIIGLGAFFKGMVSGE